MARKKHKKLLSARDQGSEVVTVPKSAVTQGTTKPVLRNPYILFDARLEKGEEFTSEEAEAEIVPRSIQYRKYLFSTGC